MQKKRKHAKKALQVERAIVQDAYEITSRLDGMVYGLMEKFGEGANKLANHTERLNSVDQKFDELKDEQREIRRDFAENSRFLLERMDESQKTITDHFDKTFFMFKSEQEKAKEKQDAEVDQLDRRVSTLEKYRWIFYGGGLVVLSLAGFVLKPFIEAFLKFMF